MMKTLCRTNRVAAWFVLTSALAWLGGCGGGGAGGGGEADSLPSSGTGSGLGGGTGGSGGAVYDRTYLDYDGTMVVGGCTPSSTPTLASS